MKKIVKSFIMLIVLGPMLLLYSCDESLATNYRVTFELNGGLLDSSSVIIVKENEEVVLLTPYKDGYRFLGWYFNNELVNENRYHITDDATFVAKWESNKYNIHFNPNGGVVGYSQIEVDYQEDFVLPIPTREGYQFLGWYNENILYNETNYLIIGDLSLLAKWEPITKDYKVIYVTYSGFLPDTYFNQGEQVTLEVPTKDGYDFLGWYDNPFHQGDLINSLPSNLDEDITLYAEWGNEDLVAIFYPTRLNKTDVNYSELSLYQYGKPNSATLYWYKAGIIEKEGRYFVSKTGLSGDKISDIGEYDYLLTAYSASSYYQLLQKIAVNDEIIFSEAVDSLETGTINLMISIKREIIEVSDYLEGLLGTTVTITDDLSLPMVFQDNLITWTTSNKDVISSTGEYQKPYETMPVTLKAIVEDNCVFEVTFSVKGEVDHYHALNTGYIYTQYSKVTEQTIEALDIAYCAFIEVDSNGNFTNALETSNVIKNITTYILPKAKKYNTKVIFSVNKGSTTAFGDLSSTPETRRRLAENIVALINQYGFDGVDIDWEVPTTAQIPNFVLMMKEIYTLVKANNPEHLVTAAIGGGKWQPPKYDLPNSIAYMDYVNVMLYSMCSTNGYHQSALYKSTRGYTLNSCSVEETLDIYEQLNVPRSKMLIGVPFYGIRQYESNGIGTTSSSDSKSISYASLYTDYISKGYQQYYDEECEVPYIYDDINKVFISYDNERSLQRKCEYIKTKGLAGIMYWQDGHDYEDLLLLAIYQNLNK